MERALCSQGSARKACYGAIPGDRRMYYETNPTEAQSGEDEPREQSETARMPEAIINHQKRRHA